MLSRLKLKIGDPDVQSSMLEVLLWDWDVQQKSIEKRAFIEQLQTGNRLAGLWLDGNEGMEKKCKLL